jgi:hypothetical protein
MSAYGMRAEGEAMRDAAPILECASSLALFRNDDSRPPVTN